MSIEEIRGRLDAATPGPWGWFGNTDAKNICLATQDRGRQFIMTFRRWGMQGAQPWFNTDMWMKPASEQVRYAVAPAAESRDDPRVYRADISGINHPDAEFIAHAPEDVRCLLNAVEAVRGLHQPVTVYELDPLNGTWVYDESDERKVMAVLCSECTPDHIIEEIDESEYDGPNDIDVDFPCPTVKAIASALDPS